MRILPATPADLARIEQAACADGHPVFGATHFLQNDAGEVRGYFSAGGVTNVFFWSHTANDKFTSLNLVKASQEAAKASGKPVFYPCSKTSPFRPLLPSLGFELIGEAEFYKLK